MTSITTYVVDSFTNQPFKGNPAGVCIIEEKLDDAQMLLIAQELGLSETAFIQKKEQSNNQEFTIRYFSPKMEILLCGHATLASAKVLFSIYDSVENINFTTNENLSLPVQRKGKQIQMTFPIYDTSPMPAPKHLIEALGIKTIINSVYNSETNILLLEIDDRDLLESLRPNFVDLYNSHQKINGVLVTAPSTKGNYDFESRYFWPWSGTNEDPVTGGTHTFLAKYWSEKLNKTKMNSFQCSERSGFMTVELLNDNQMTISSEAQIVLEGKLFI